MRHLPLLLVLALIAAAPKKDPVSLIKPPPQVQTKTFDPRNPPPDMPPLSPQEAAVTHSEFAASSQVEVLVLADTTTAGRTTSRIKVESLSCALSLNITLWLPEKATRPLIEHEQAHQRISELFYKDADQPVRNLAKQYIGQTLVGQGSSADAARNAAMEKLTTALNSAYMTYAQIPAARVNQIFDDITDHGRKNIAIDKAIEQSLAQYRAELQKKR
jgi:hypothetical protein